MKTPAALWVTGVFLKVKEVLHMPKIKGLSHVVLYVNDLDKMVSFYRDVLGLVKYRVNKGSFTVPAHRTCSSSISSRMAI